jgi:diguanylate cyclase (GGDEF)-like protein
MISLVMMDIDNFKGYNDTYGHIKGDEVIKNVTNIINQQTRKGDVFARYGGEEFILVLNDVTKEFAYKIAEKLRKSVEALALEHRQSSFGYITLSIGVVTRTTDRVANISQFVNAADEALYKAKEAGRNNVYFELENES